MAKSWSEHRTARIGKVIRELRGSRTGQWLADETKALGHPVSRTTISETETGSRKDITLAEISVIARALDVPPLLLIFPDLAVGEVEALPGCTVTSAQAMRWFAGEESLPGAKFKGSAVQRMRWTRYLYNLAIQAQQRLNYAVSISNAAEASPEAVEAAVASARDGLDQVIRWVDLMKESDFDVAGEDIHSFIASAKAELADAEG